VKQEGQGRSAKTQEVPDDGIKGSKNYWMHNFERGTQVFTFLSNPKIVVFRWIAKKPLSNQ
jgi:hypothetical protein